MREQHTGAGKPAPKRVIKSSKGGRTARAPGARLTPADLAVLRVILSVRGISYADWLAAKIAADSQPALEYQRHATPDKA
jgi:hypothetical protein